MNIQEFGYLWSTIANSRSIFRPWLLGDGAALLGLVERRVAGLAPAVPVHTFAEGKLNGNLSIIRMIYL